MSIRYLAMLAAGMVLTGNALAEEGEALAEKNNCMACHTIFSPSMGPAFKNVAAKYKDNKSAQAILEKKVRSGGAGAWGKIPMPATANSVSDNDIRNIVKWVLSLK